MIAVLSSEKIKKLFREIKTSSIITVHFETTELKNKFINYAFLPKYINTTKYKYPSVIAETAQAENFDFYYYYLFPPKEYNTYVYLKQIKKKND